MTVSHETLLVRLHPRGWNLDEGSMLRADLRPLAVALDAVWAQVELLRDELHVISTLALLTRWETEFGIVRIEGKSVPERIAAVVAHMRILPSFRPADMAALLTTLCGFAVTIFEPFAFRCADPDSTCGEADDVLGALLFYALLDEETARESGLTRDEIDFFISLIKPAHTVGMVRCDDFRCGDPWSLVGIDLLGE